MRRLLGGWCVCACLRAFGGVGGTHTHSKKYTHLLASSFRSVIILLCWILSRCDKVCASVKGRGDEARVHGTGARTLGACASADLRRERVLQVLLDPPQLLVLGVILDLHLDVLPALDLSYANGGEHGHEN